MQKVLQKFDAKPSPGRSPRCDMERRESPAADERPRLAVSPVAQQAWNVNSMCFWTE